MGPLRQRRLDHQFMSRHPLFGLYASWIIRRGGARLSRTSRILPPRDLGGPRAAEDDAAIAQPAATFQAGSGLPIRMLQGRCDHLWLHGRQDLPAIDA